jgi:hypothetical protein
MPVYILAWAGFTVLLSKKCETEQEMAQCEPWFNIIIADILFPIFLLIPVSYRIEKSNQ